jgi:charged multivesicular body protein 4
MRLFGRKKPTPTPQDSIHKLRETIEMLTKREEFLEKKIEKELQIAKQNASKNKRVAMMALKRKKAYEAQVQKLSGARMTIESQLMAIEGATVNLETINAMRQGAAALQGIHGSMSIDTVDNTMDQIREQMDIATEISDAIAQPLGDPIDEDELEAELAELEAENLDEQLLSLNNPPVGVSASPIKLPSAPTNQLPAQAARQPQALRVETDEEAELRALEESMAFG